MTENPYDPLRPVKDPLLFTGRQDAFSFLQRHLTTGSTGQKGIIIFGLRGIGKSSFLGQVPFYVDERYVTVLIDINTLELDDIVSFVAAVVDQTRNMMEAIEASTYRLPPFPDPTDPEVNLLDWLANDYLSVVMSAIWRERHLVILLDDIHLFFEAVDGGKFPADFMAYLQKLLLLHERLNLIATLDIYYEARALQTPPFDEERLHLRLTPLAADETKQMIVQPMQEVYTFEPAALDTILALTGGYPFHVHSICRLLYRLWQERTHVDHISLREVEAVYPAALEQAIELLTPIWQQFTPNERLVLTALVDLRKHNPAEAAFPPRALLDWLKKTEFPLNEIQLAATWRKLEYAGMVQSGLNGNYAFAASLQADAFLNMIESGDETRLRKPPPWPDLQWVRNPLVWVGGLALVGIVLLMVIFAGGGNDDTDSVDRPTLTLPSEQEPTATPTQAPLFRFGG